MDKSYREMIKISIEAKGSDLSVLLDAISKLCLSPPTSQRFALGLSLKQIEETD